MIRLDLSRGPAWLDLGHGVRVEARPLTTAVMSAARTRLAKASAEANDAGAEIGDRGLAFLKALGVAAIVAWDGVGDAEGQPAAVTDAGVEALLDIYQIAGAFERLYLVPALLLADEKNGFAPSPNGISAGAPPIATAAAGGAPTARMN